MRIRANSGPLAGLILLIALLASITLLPILITLARPKIGTPKSQRQQ